MNGEGCVPGVSFEASLEFYFPEIFLPEHVLAHLDFLLQPLDGVPPFPGGFLGVCVERVYFEIQFLDLPIFLFEPPLVLFLHLLEAQSQGPFVLLLFLK